MKRPADQIPEEPLEFTPFQPEEFGGWRMHLESPEVAERIKPIRLSFLQRLLVQVESLQNAELVIEPLRGRARLVRFCIAVLLLLPLSVLSLLTLMMLIYHAAPTMGITNFWLSDSVWFTMVGLVSFFSLIVTNSAETALIYLYVLGHEATHAVATLLSFGRISNFVFTTEGGYVETDADNIFIALSPYFVPFWMLVWMFFFWLGNCFFPFDSYVRWLYGGIGFWWAFHLYWTIWVINRKQPDILENGRTFSMLVIVLMNVWVMMGILCLFGLASPSSIGGELCRSGLLLLETFHFYASRLTALLF